AAQRTDPQIIFVVRKKSSDRVVGQAVFCHPVRNQSVGCDPANSMRLRSNPKVFVVVRNKSCDRTMQGQCELLKTGAPARDELRESSRTADPHNSLLVHVGGCYFAQLLMRNGKGR